MEDAGDAGGEAEEGGGEKREGWECGSRWWWRWWGEYGCWGREAECEVCEFVGWVWRFKGSFGMVGADWILCVALWSLDGGIWIWIYLHS